MSEIFREIDEELRHESLQRLWKRFGPYIIGLAVAIVLATAGVIGWRQYQQARQEKWALAFSEAMAVAAEGSYESAAVAFGDLAKESGKGYATLARFEEASLLARIGKTEEAITLYRELAREAPDSTLRELASLLAVFYEVDSGDPETLATALAPLTADDNPWHYTARELTALLAIRKGDKARAKEILEPLSKDTSAPEGIRQRAGEMMAIVGE